MTDYRIVTRHVRYWRGALHKWSNVYPLTGTLAAGDYLNALAAVRTCEQQILYPGNTSDQGGTWEEVLYNQAVGGVPIAVQTHGDPNTPTSVPDYLGTAWPDVTHILESTAEVAMLIEWPAGLSSSGKPVTFKKWYHSVPSSGATSGAADISTATATSIAAKFTTMANALSALGAPIGRGGRLAALTPRVVQYYGNHQMPRGRRRVVKAAARPAAQFPPNLLVVPGSDGSLEA